MGKNIKSPQAVADAWASGMSGAGQAYTQGVQGVSESPGATAARNVDKYISGVQQSVANGSYQKGLQSFTLQDWQTAAVQKGASRLGSGAQASKGRMATFFTSFLPQLQGIKNQLDQMPTGSYEDRMAKQRAYADAVHALKGQLRTK